MHVSRIDLFAGAAAVLAAGPLLTERLAPSSSYDWILNDEKAVVIINSVTPTGMGPEVHMGAGFLVAVERDEAYVLTANHVAPNDGSKIIVTLGNRYQVYGKVIGAAPTSQADVSVLGVPAAAARGLPILTLGNSDRLTPGEHVTIIGHPLFNYYTVSHGIVSAMHRADAGLGLKAQDNVLTDAPINGGNSGGPVIDDDTGKVVAITDFLPQMPNSYPNPGYGGKFDGLGALVSSRIAEKVYDDVRIWGRVVSGTSRMEVTDNVTRPLLDNPAVPKLSHGARVVSVQDGSAAAAVGIRPNDVIVSVNGGDVTDRNDFDVAEFLSHPGDVEQITALRNGRPVEFQFPQGGDAILARNMAGGTNARAKLGLRQGMP